MQRSLLTLLAFGLFSTVVAAGDWTNWRGPDMKGVASGTGYATSWSADENILWKVPMPGAASSTPIVLGKRIYLTTPADGKNAVLCLRLSDGGEVWRTTVGTERPGKHKKASGSNPSPVTDGRHVYVYFKSGDLACLDLTGKLLWQHNLQEKFGEDTLWWDLGTSPVLTRSHVVVAVMQSGPSYVAAFDKQTGELSWKQDRMLDAPEEANQSYSTPIVTTQGDREILVILGADHVTAHEAETGGELWRLGGLNPTNHKYFRSIASPVVNDDLVIAPYARGGSLTAIRRGGSGDVTSTHIAWFKEGHSADVPTPALADDLLFVCSDKGVVSCLNVATGDVIWEQQLPKNRNAYSSSPIVADGKLYLTREDGATFVVAAAENYELLGSGELNEMTVSTPVLVNGRILIRTFENLYCIGK